MESSSIVNMPFERAHTVFMSTSIQTKHITASSVFIADLIIAKHSFSLLENV